MATYEIILRNSTGGGTGSPNASVENVSSNAKQEQEQEQANTFKAVAISAKIINYAYKIASYNAEMIGVRTGQHEYQQKMQLLQDGAFKLGSLAVKAMITGSIFGPIGALTTVITGALDTAIKLEQNQATINTQSNLENISIRQNNIRAGSSGNRGSRMNY